MIAVVTFLVMCFKKQLITTKEKMAQAAKIDNTGVITNFAAMWRSVIVLTFVIIGFVLHDITYHNFMLDIV